MLTGRRKILDCFILAACLWWVFAASPLSAQTKSPTVRRELVEQKLSETLEAIKANDLDGAEKMAGEVLKLAPQNAAAQTLAGIVYDRRNDLAKAPKYLRLCRVRMVHMIAPRSGSDPSTFPS